MADSIEHKEPKKKKSGKSVFALIENVFKLEEAFKKETPFKLVPRIIFLVCLGVFYIWNTHYSDRLSRNFEKTKKDVQDLRADYTTLKADYMYESKQSEVAKKVESIGLKEGVKAPEKIVIDKNEK